jgi:hypothetical protein
MSDFSESDSTNHSDCHSDGECLVASSYVSEVHEVQDSRKRPRPPQVQGNSWILCCKMTIIELHADSDWKAAGPEGDGENEGIISKINTRQQRLLGYQFETLFGKMYRKVKSFVVFCNLISLFDFETNTNDAVNVEVEIRDLLQLQPSETNKSDSASKIALPVRP